MLQIVEILRPAEQGRSTPYLCRGEDGEHYFVKGRNTGRRSQWCEWLVGCLGRAMGLPIPPFQLVDVPEALLRETPREWREIGAGIAFASCRHPVAQWFEPGFVDKVPDSLRGDVLVFDWWVRNEDRKWGNPNLLWDNAAQELVVIDHNMAFDRDFSAGHFREQHIFRDCWDSIAGDLERQAFYADKLLGVLDRWEEACDNVPPEWRWENDEHDVPVDFDPLAARATLERCKTMDFWRVV